MASRQQILTASFIGSLFFVAIGILPAYAQQEEDSNNSMTTTTSKGSLDIKLEPIESNSTSVTYKVSFLNPGTETLHQHQDYDFKILKGGQEVFSAAKQTNQPLIHNVEGTISVPYDFEEGGEYSVDVEILGLGFGPTLVPTDEDAVFSVQIVPEFPVAFVGIMAMTVIGSAIALTRKFKTVA